MATHWKIVDSWLWLGGLEDGGGTLGGPCGDLCIRQDVVVCGNTAFTL